MPTEPTPVSLFQVVQRAVDVVDPNGADEGSIEMLRRFEDADEPVTAIVDVEQRLAEAAGAIDPQQEDADTLLRLAARAEFDGKPPEPVASWLSDVGVEV